MSARSSRKIEPWERLGGESDDAFAAFNAYRELGPRRTIAKLVEPLGYKTDGSLNLWSQRHSWVARAAAWDEHVEAAKRDAHIKEVERIAKQQANIISGTLTAMALPMQALLQKVKENPNELRDTHTQSELLDRIDQYGNTIERFIKLQRLIIGEPTDITAQNASVAVGPRDDVAKAIMDDPESAALASQLLQRTAARLSDAGGLGLAHVGEDVDTGGALGDAEPPPD